MRITKDASREIARILAKKKEIEKNNALLEYKTLVTSEYIKQTPKDVLDVFAKYPDWMEDKNQVVLVGHGFNYEYVSTTERVIRNKANGCYLSMSDTLASKIVKAKRKADNAREEYEKLVSEIEVALCGLRTFAQIEKNLPEAVPYLPKSTSMELMVNFADLRKKLK